MTSKIHIISSFLCLHCCQQFRLEIGLPENLAFALEEGTFEEVMDHFPEVFEELKQDEIQNNVFGRFIFEHGQHDVRFLSTKVETMLEIVRLRTRHYKQVVALYQQYQEVGNQLRQVLKQQKSVNFPTIGSGNKRFYLKEDRKKK